MKTEAYINEHKKYHGSSLVLTIFFGPLVGASCVADYNRKLKMKAAMFSSGGFLEV